MASIIRNGKSEEWAHASTVEAGGFVFVSYCMGNEGQDVVAQMNGAFDTLETRLKEVGLGLGQVVQMDCLFRDISDLDVFAEVIKQRFGGDYPARKAYETKFIREGIAFQVDAVAFRG